MATGNNFGGKQPRGRHGPGHTHERPRGMGQHIKLQLDVRAVRPHTTFAPEHRPRVGSRAMHNVAPGKHWVFGPHWPR